MNEPEGKVFLLSSEGIGYGEEMLGYQIPAILESLIKCPDRFAAIICWNRAVRLEAKGSPLGLHFNRLEEKGVRILLGKLCIGECESNGSIAVGKKATMAEMLALTSFAIYRKLVERPEFQSEFPRYSNSSPADIRSLLRK